MNQMLAKENTQEQKQKQWEKTTLEEKINEMEIEGLENFPKLFRPQPEKKMVEFNGSVKELRGSFKITKTNIQPRSLNRQICKIAK